MMVHCITMIVQSYVNKSYLETREGRVLTAIEIITTAVCPYPHGVPCVQVQYSGVTASIITNSPPVRVSMSRELESGAVSVQIKVTVTKVDVIGHCVPHEHICPRHRGREEPSGRVVPRSFVCFYGVVYHRQVVMSELQ